MVQAPLFLEACRLFVDRCQTFHQPPLTFTDKGLLEHHLLRKLQYLVNAFQLHILKPKIQHKWAGVMLMDGLSWPLDPALFITIEWIHSSHHCPNLPSTQFPGRRERFFLIIIQFRIHAYIWTNIARERCVQADFVQCHMLCQGLGPD